MARSEPSIIPILAQDDIKIASGMIDNRRSVTQVEKIGVMVPFFPQAMESKDLSTIIVMLSGYYYD